MAARQGDVDSADFGESIEQVGRARYHDVDRKQPSSYMKGYYIDWKIPRFQFRSPFLQTEDMLKKHDDFIPMLTAQEDKAKNVGKDPSLAQAKQMEVKKDRDAKEKEDKQRLEELKKKEKEKLVKGENNVSQVQKTGVEDANCRVFFCSSAQISMKEIP